MCFDTSNLLSIRIMESVVRTFLTSLVLLVVLLTTGTALADEVQVAVAANFRSCLEELATLFQTRTGHTVQVSVGSTGRHFAQIKAGAPFDIFLAADVQRPRLLEKDGLTVPGSRFTYAQGRLVLWAPGLEFIAGDSLTTILDDPDLTHLALANPRLAPYGYAARQTMEALERWGSLQECLVLGQSVGQAWQFTASGNAQAAFVALAQLDEASRRQALVVPETLHDPINQQAVLLLRGSENPAAQAFLPFLQGDEARAVIAAHGYSMPAPVDF